MIYPVTRIFAAVSLRFFFRKIYLSHVEKIPRDKPVILASNHPTAFLEPSILGCFLDRPLYFLVRGNLFVKPVYTFLLRSLHMLPIYRREDRGYKFLTANYSTFDACFDALQLNKSIVILSEGRTRLTKRLHPLMKGTARMAFGTLEKYPDLDDVYVVPVGANFTYGDRFRSEVMIDFGDPISIRDYWVAYQENANTSIADFTNDLWNRMKDGIIHVEDPEDDELAEYLLVLTRNEEKRRAFPVFQQREEPFRREKQVADRINDMNEEMKDGLLEKARRYYRDLDKHSLTDETVRWHPRFNILESGLMALGLPIYGIGYLLNILPAWLAKTITNTNVKQIEFHAPVLWATSLGAYLTYYIMLAIILPLTFGGWGWLMTGGIALLGIFTLYYRDSYQQWRNDRKMAKLPIAQQEALRKQRTQLRESFTSG